MTFSKCTTTNYLILDMRHQTIYRNYLQGNEYYKYVYIHMQYTCRIAVGIPKTAIRVTAILLTAISETAMAAKN